MDITPELKAKIDRFTVSARRRGISVTVNGSVIRCALDRNPKTYRDYPLEDFFSLRSILSELGMKNKET